MLFFVSVSALMFQNSLFADLSSCLNENSFSGNKSFSEQLKKEAEEGNTQSQYDLGLVMISDLELKGTYLKQ